MNDSTLPVELLKNVFGYLTPSSLAATSRVCRTWQVLAFPLLYRTVYLCLATHLEQISQRICSESKDAGNQFSIAAHLRGLVLDIEYLEDRELEIITKSNVIHLNAIIPRLTCLTSLSWNLMFVPWDLETFRLFQTRCPNLTSVHIWVQEEIDWHSEPELYEELLDFKDLTYFSLSLRYLPNLVFSDEESEFHKPLTAVLARCPQLSSILFDFDSDSGESQYSPTLVVAPLGDQFVFSNLRRFYARGYENAGWLEFFENPDSHPLRQFFVRHPRIEDLALGYVYETAYTDEIDPAEIARLFPSLKHFEGRAFIFIPLVLSTLAEQVETLVISDGRLSDYEAPLSRMYDKVSVLPKLRKFGIWSETVDDGVLVDVLRTIVHATSQLEEIEIHADMERADYEKVVSLFAEVPRLRSVTLDESVLTVAAGNGDEALGWSGFASNLRRLCPELRTIYRPIRKFGGDNREKVWELCD
ncbi:hypothetical protein FRC11_002834 [Ceratobasidium sp. 423]|nr:hypothetical protein FRC11_002834 [Ceratobasidium sp. 423]